MWVILDVVSFFEWMFSMSRLCMHRKSPNKLQVTLNKPWHQYFCLLCFLLVVFSHSSGQCLNRMRFMTFWHIFSLRWCFSASVITDFIWSFFLFSLLGMLLLWIWTSRWQRVWMLLTPPSFWWLLPSITTSRTLMLLSELCTKEKVWSGNHPCLMWHFTSPGDLTVIVLTL